MRTSRIAPEDKERIHRFTTLGYNVGRIENWVYHLEHARGDNSWLTNPHMQNNFALWEFLQSLDEESFLDNTTKNRSILKNTNDWI